WHQGRDGQRAGQTGAARDGSRGQRAPVRQYGRQDPREHRDRRVSVTCVATTCRVQGAGSPTPSSNRSSSRRVEGSQPLEMDITQHRPNHGWIEVIAGSMFSGKSEELIRRLRRAQIARRKVQIFKPQIDDRYSEDHIISHSEMRIPSENLSSSRELLERVLPDTEVVGIDEGQFFDADLPAVCNELADQGKRVI